jgi:hypothetical protein
MVGNIHVGGLLGVPQKAHLAFMDCRGDFTDQDKKDYDYRHMLSKNDVFEHIVINRLCKLGNKGRPKFEHEFASAFTSVVRGLRPDTLVHCIQGASRSQTVCMGLLVGGDTTGCMTAEKASAFLRDLRGIADHTGMSRDHMTSVQAIHFYSSTCREICAELGVRVRPCEIKSASALVREFEDLRVSCQEEFNLGIGKSIINLRSLRIGASDSASAFGVASGSASAFGSASGSASGHRTRGAAASCDQNPAECKRNRDQVILVC